MPLKDVDGRPLIEGDVVGLLFVIKKIHTQDEYSSMDLESVEVRKPDHEKEKIVASSSIVHLAKSAAEYQRELAEKDELEAERLAFEEAEAERAKLREREKIRAEVRRELEAEEAAKLKVDASPAALVKETQAEKEAADLLGEGDKSKGKK